MEARAIIYPDDRYCRRLATTDLHRARGKFPPTFYSLESQSIAAHRHLEQNGPFGIGVDLAHRQRIDQQGPSGPDQRPPTPAIGYSQC